MKPKNCVNKNYFYIQDSTSPQSSSIAESQTYSTIAPSGSFKDTSSSHSIPSTSSISNDISEGAVTLLMTQITEDMHTIGIYLEKLFKHIKLSSITSVIKLIIISLIKFYFDINIQDYM